MSDVALLLIGNELLTGKIQDQNGPYLAKVCFDAGANLNSITIVPDTLDAIANAVSRLKDTADLLITSGGVGPTHDDITYAGIAQALGTDLETNQVLAHRIEAYFGAKTTDAHRKMAVLPRGAQLEFPKGSDWPTVRVRNIYVFPGVPQIFKYKIERIKDQLSGPRKVVRLIRVKGDEGTIAAHLAWAEANFAVEIGSYPLYGKQDINIHVTLEGYDVAILESAYAALTNRLQPLVETLLADTAKLSESG